MGYGINFVRIYKHNSGNWLYHIILSFPTCVSVFHLIDEANSVTIRAFSMLSPLSILTIAGDGSKQRYINNEN
jgi:hypothetical protein